MDKMTDSSPGPDGVRYSAWRAGGVAAVDGVYALVEAMFK